MRIWKDNGGSRKQEMTIKKERERKTKQKMKNEICESPPEISFRCREVLLISTSRHNENKKNEEISITRIARALKKILLLLCFFLLIFTSAGKGLT